MPQIYVKRPRPLIVPRMEFELAPRADLPVIAARINFTQRAIQRQAPAAVATTVSQSHLGHGPSPPNTPKKLIPKPPGEPGRPNSGGFALETTLQKHGWTEVEIECLLAEVKKASEEMLDTSVSISKQNPDLINRICSEMSSPERWPVLADYDNCWPVLADYDNCWPVRSALKLSLKYKAEASRRRKD